MRHVTHDRDWGHNKMFKRTHTAVRAGAALAFLCLAAVSAQAGDRTGSIGHGGPAMRGVAPIGQARSSSRQRSARNRKLAC